MGITHRMLIGLGMAMLAAVWLASTPSASAAVGGGCVVSSCSCAPASCTNMYPTGTNNCGGSCSCTAYSSSCTVSSGTAKTCSSDHRYTFQYGTDECSRRACQTNWIYLGCPEPSGYRCGTGTAASSNSTCGSCTYGGRSCTSTTTTISPNWVPYGFALPDGKDSNPYKFNYAGYDQTDFLGLAAKGNVVIGDYTSGRFQDDILPYLHGDEDSKSRPYAVDPTDETLGYHTGLNGLMYDEKGRPLFDGNYDAWDGGYKPADPNAAAGSDDATTQERKFYESTLPNSVFKSLIADNCSVSCDKFYKDWGTVERDGAKIDAVLFTNHALTGVVRAHTLWVNGAMVSRDEALEFNTKLAISHDIRLLDKSFTNQLALPQTFTRPTVSQWLECQPAGCPQ